MHPAARKNILDLTYTKYLNYYSTTIIIMFTYLIGLLLALLTKQALVSSITGFMVMTGLSLIFFMSAVMALLRFKDKQKKIIEEIRNI
ncbi:hypothetical protein JW968_01300 [Candidatus Woesearchaeota archaeon]|nr:hypothetical protein [Candidatus Woesearchaeota archaeon]